VVGGEHPRSRFENGEQKWDQLLLCLGKAVKTEVILHGMFLEGVLREKLTQKLSMKDIVHIPKRVFLKNSRSRF
jgi:hypothetical protein